MSRRLAAHVFGLMVWAVVFMLLHLALPYARIPFWPSLSQSWRVFIELNLATLLLFGFDKVSAQAKLQRIPERVLYLTTFLGGSIGALIAMSLFRHKTRKTSFQLVIALLILVQIAIAYSLA